MELGVIIQRLYESEINCEVTTFWDAGLTVKLGDNANGFVAETEVRTSEEAARWLDDAACRHFPESVYALGQPRWDQLNRERGKLHRVK